MARKVKSSVSIVESEVHFGDTITIDYTTDDPHPWARVYVYANETTLSNTGGEIAPGTLVFGASVDVWRGNVTVTLGQTPMWAGGGGDGTVQLLNYDAGRETKLTRKPTPFAVLP